MEAAATGAAELVRVVEQSDKAGILTLGRGDLIIDNQSGSVHFLICHESDLHLVTFNRALLEQTAAQWRKEGLTVYVSAYVAVGHREWTISE